MAEKILKLRLFEDEGGKMNEALGQREILCVSQFTLCADTKSGTRPGFSSAADPEAAEPLYEHLVGALGAKRGVFGASMKVELVNDGPVTIPLET